MRIVPLALAFRGDDLLEAARISALLTHAHPNALEAAMAGAWLVGQVLETGLWGGDLVAEAIRGLEGPWGQGGTVAESLRAALAWVERGEDWLDEGMIPPGDGGWRSGSALGLGVAAALRWPDDLGLAVEKAARIRGDSDSVACLTGALLGAALGEVAIPPAWLATCRGATRSRAWLTGYWPKGWTSVHRGEAGRGPKPAAGRHRRRPRALGRCGSRGRGAGGFVSRAAVWAAVLARGSGGGD